MTKNELKQLHELVKEFSTDELTVVAELGEIQTTTGLKPVIRTSVVHLPSKKAHTVIYRGVVSEFRNFLKKNIDEFVNSIHREIVLEAEKKNKKDL